MISDKIRTSVFGSVILFVCCMSCKKDYRYEYHPAGNVKSKLEVEDGQKDGLLLEYFPNGDLKSKQHWVKGKLDGDFIDYYEGAIVWRKGRYSAGKRIGEWIYFNKNGGVFQAQMYDLNGNIHDVRRFLSDGQRDLRPFPYIFFNSPESGDTLAINVKQTLVVKLVNVSDSTLKADNLILTNSLVQNEAGRMEVTDTIAVIRPTANSEYRYDFVPSRVGADRFLGLIHCQKDHKETIEMITMAFSYPIFVRGKGNENFIHHAAANRE